MGATARIYSIAALAVSLLLASCGGSPTSTQQSDPFDFRISCWGDSFTAGLASPTYPDALAQLTGATVYNGGVSGETSTQIATRMLAATDQHSDITIIWAGTNNVTNPDQTLTDIASIVAALNPPQRFLILSVMNQDSPGHRKGKALYNLIVSTNASLAATYPNNYLDIRTLLVNAYNPSLLDDAASFQNDVIPASLRRDSEHPNSSGNQFIAQQVALRLSAEGWVK